MARTSQFQSPIDDLLRDWLAVSRSPAAETAYQRLVTAEPTIAARRAPDLASLIATLMPVDDGTDPEPSVGEQDGSATHGPATRDAPATAHRPPRAPEGATIIRALLRSAELDPIVTRALVQALVPGLVGVARRLTWGRGGEWSEPSAFFVDVISTTWEVAQEWAGADRPYAVLDILSAVRCRLRRRMLAFSRRSRTELPSVEPVQAAHPVARGPSDLDALARAIELARSRTITERDASVLYAHRVLGFSITEIAEQTGRSRRLLARCSGRAASAILA